MSSPAVDRIPAPLLSRHTGVVVVTLSVLAAAALVVLPPLGFWPFAAALALAAGQQGLLALTVLLLGRTGLAGRRSLPTVLATLATVGSLLLAVLAEIVLVVVVGLVPGVASAWFWPCAAALTGLVGLSLAVVGLAVLRAGVVHPGARILPLLAGLGLLAAAALLLVDPLGLGVLAVAAATLLSGGVGLALFTPRTLK